MKKTKPVPPVVGDMVRLRGRTATGVLKAIRSDTLWCKVEWIGLGGVGPQITHLEELKKIE